jgi:RHS repeat-associated protein
VSNESNFTVFFDNLQVVHKPGPITEENHYYPFGLTMAGISSKAAGNLENRIKFTSQELDSNLGWNTYQMRFRTHDPQIGRFLQIDPLAPQYVHNSTYAYAENDVIRAIDLEGLEKYIVTFRAFIPQEKVRNPDSTRNDKYYAGDNRREYQANATRYRTSQSVNVDFDNKKMSRLQNIAAGSTGLDKDGKPITSSTAGKAGNIQGNTDAFEKGEDNAVIKFDTHASNKLSAAAPAIDAVLNLTITPGKDGTFNFSVSGATDGFPAYELWVTDDKGNSYLLFNRNPIESKETPLSLFPPMEHKYDYKGTSKDVNKGSTLKFSETTNTKEKQ